MRRIVVAALLSAAPVWAATRLLVSVAEQKSAKPVGGLKAADFTVVDGNTPRRVEAAEFVSGPIDVMLLVDASLLGHSVQPVAADMIGQLQEKEQMALVAFDSSADLVRDFTSSRNSLLQALSELKFGNFPRVLDALFAAADGGFEHSTFRRVILLLTSGVEGDSRVSERSVIKLARKNGISIYPLYMSGRERGMFELLARQTGGVPMNIRELGRATEKPAVRVFDVMRGHYALTLSGNLALGEKIKVEVKRPEKLFVSALPLD